FRTIYSQHLYETNERVFRLLENVGIKDESRRFLILAEATERFDAGDALSFVKCPSLVIGAEDDRVLSVDASYDTAARLVVIPYIYNDYGHAVYDEAPDYKDRLLCFLTEN
ncbi:MAG: alpha/beta hydrolase, partial [Clostridia bacterium]|nr:alpha/beta hydrolase [Clostridia bacterium]